MNIVVIPVAFPAIVEILAVLIPVVILEVSPVYECFSQLAVIFVFYSQFMEVAFIAILLISTSSDS